jgi:hypothetical protein
MDSVMRTDNRFRSHAEGRIREAIALCNGIAVRPVLSRGTQANSSMAEQWIVEGRLL